MMTNFFESESIFGPRFHDSTRYRADEMDGCGGGTVSTASFEPEGRILHTGLRGAPAFTSYCAGAAGNILRFL
jgi:hypothetical protein